MIYTVTCNPALDCTVRLDCLRMGEMNRTADNVLTVGGKGINVSRVLTACGEENLTLAFVAGDTGALMETTLRRQNIQTDFITLPAGQTRINVKLYADTETELNAPGAPITAEAFAALHRRLAALSAGDMLCLCGSLPPGLGADAYRQILTWVEGRGVYTVLDTAGAPLSAALPAHPWLIKPNRTELCQLMGEELPTLADVACAAAQLQQQGARHVLVSLGGDGALLCTQEGERLYQPAPEGRVQGTVGAGDSLVAGFAAGWQREGDLHRALRLGVATGSATAFSQGLADMAAVEQVLQRLPGLVSL